MARGYKFSNTIFRDQYQNVRYNAQSSAEVIAARAKQLNQRFYRLEKAGYSRDTAYIYAQSETGKERPRYTESVSKIAKMSNEERYELAMSIGIKLESATSTIEGLKETYENRVIGSLQALSTGKHIDSDNAEVFEDLSGADWEEFLRNGGGEMLNNKFLSSDQVINDWLDNRKKDISTKEFVKEYKRQKAYYAKHPRSKKYGSGGAFRPEYSAMRKKWNKVK